MLFGTGEKYYLDYWWNTGQTLLEKYQDLIENPDYGYQRWGFNTARLSFVFPDQPFDPALDRPILDYNKLDEVLNILEGYGIKVIIDCHNYRALAGWCGSQAWIDDWLAFAQRYKGDKRILGYELFNEPFSSQWAPNIQSRDDLCWAFANLTDAIRAIEPSRTIVWCDPGYLFNPAKELTAGTYRSNVIFDFHAWAWDKNWSVAEALQEAQDRINLADHWKTLYPNTQCWLGEFGVLSAYPPEPQDALFNVLVNVFFANHEGFSIWWFYGMQQGQLRERYSNLLTETDYVPGAPPTPPIPIVQITAPIGTGLILALLGSL